MLKNLPEHRYCLFFFRACGRELLRNLCLLATFNGILAECEDRISGTILSYTCADHKDYCSDSQYWTSEQTQRIKYMCPKSCADEFPGEDLCTMDMPASMAWTCTTLVSAQTVDPTTDVKVMCDPGTGFNQTSALCEPCEPGTFGRGGPESECHACTPGKSAPEMSMDACEVAPAGQTYVTTTSASPTDCEAGEYSSGGACVKCHAGSWSANNGSASCTTCGAGRILPTPKEDALDWVMNVNREPDCETCPLGTITAIWTKQEDVSARSLSPSENGGQGCLACNEGPILGWRSNPDDFYCTHCPNGKFLPHKYYDPSVNQADNCISDCSQQCTSYNETTDQCDEYAGSSSKMSRIWNNCVFLPESLVGDGLGKCEPGQVPDAAASGECTKCQNNTFAQSGWASCVACDAGYYSEEGASGCLPQPVPPTCEQDEIVVPQGQNYEGIVGTLFSQNGVPLGCSAFGFKVGMLQYFPTDRFCFSNTELASGPGYTSAVPGYGHWAMDSDYNLARVMTNSLVNGEPLVNCESGPSWMAETTDCATWGDEFYEDYTIKDGTGSYTVPFQPRPQLNWPNFQILAGVGVGLIKYDDVVKSGRGFEHMYYKYQQFRGNTPCIWTRSCSEDIKGTSKCHETFFSGYANPIQIRNNRECIMPTDQSIPRLPMTCKEAKEMSMCTAAHVAALCPQTCGIVPYHQIQEGAPVATLTLTGLKLPAWPFWTIPIRPPSMHDCPEKRYSGKWNMQTRMLDPHCDLTCHEGDVCESSSDCYGGTCVASPGRRVLFATMPGKFCSCV